MHKTEQRIIPRLNTGTGNFSWGWPLRAIIGASLLFIVIRGVDFAKVLGVFLGINNGYFMLALLSLLLQRFVMAYKWNLLTKAKGVILSVWQSFRIYLISGFFGVFLPSGIGGDIYRIYHTSKRKGQTEEITASVILERFIGIIASTLFATVGLTLMLEMSSPAYLGLGMDRMYVSVICFLILSLIAFWISIQDVTLKIVGLVKDRWGNNWLLKQLIGSHHAYVQYRGHKRLLVRVFLLAISEQFIFAIANYFAAKSIGLNIGLVYFIGIVPMIHIAMRMPISINAIGVQEGVYALFFTGLGFSITEAFGLALVIRIARWIVLLPGAILYATDSSRKKKACEGQYVCERTGKTTSIQSI